MISETRIRTAIVGVIRSADAAAKVYPRFRYPAQARLKEFADLFRDDTGKINAYMIRRIRRTPEIRGIPGRLIKVTHAYKIRFYAHLIDSDDPLVASEEIAQLKIETLSALFESDVTLGFGPSVSHEGLVMEMDFADVVLGDTAVHRNDLGITVTTANVEC